MPKSFNACGTTFYGECDFKDDASFVTTEWIIVLGIPLIPLRSVRIIRVGQSGEFVLGSHFSTEYYQVVSETPLRWSQILGTYLSTAWIAACALILIYAADEWDRFVFPIVLAFIMAIVAPFYAIGWLRKRKRNAANSDSTSEPPPGESSNL